MNKQNMFCISKKLIAGVFIVGLIVMGILLAPKQVDAAVVEDTVIYIQDDENYNIRQYWDADSTKRRTPTKEGYVFGGWFTTTTETAENAEQSADGIYYAPLKEDDLKVDIPDSAYAKFVPAKVLSVKAQNQANTDENTAKTHVRIISSLDSVNYEKVGFEIWLANKTQLLKDDNTALETTKIYTGLKEGNNVKTVADIFGGASRYLSVWQLNNVGKSNFGKIIYVRPYWVTKDGSKVDGLAKYVHIEDDYKGYISVPINLLNKEDVAKAAAGAVNMSYSNNEGKKVALTFKEVEAGRVLPEMNYSCDGNVIKMVGNAKTVGQYNAGESIFANVRFAKPTDLSTDVNVDFDTTMVKFCDWDENPFNIEEVWDVEYVK